MAREIAITAYLLFFKTIFTLFKLFPLKSKVVFVVSFSENNKKVYEEMLRQDLSCRTLFLTTEKMYPIFSKLDGSDTFLFHVKKPYEFLCSIYHLATSKIIFVDNYYGFLSASDFREGVECIQLWHANGATKKFGLGDPSNQIRGSRAIRRFRQVYARFSRIAVGSRRMADIFQKAFHISSEKFLFTGIPRTDPFFLQRNEGLSKEKLYKRYPEIIGKKVILYAPTYRDHELNEQSLRLDVSKVMSELGDDYRLMIKLHPAVRQSLSMGVDYEGVINVSSHHNLNDILFVTDILITDYSSIPFEYSILGKPMIFYFYDYHLYNQKPGIWEEFLEDIPGPIAYETDEIIKIIKNGHFDLNKIQRFSDKWNEFSKGHSSENLVKYLKEKL